MPLAKAPSDWLRAAEICARLATAAAWAADGVVPTLWLPEMGVAAGALPMEDMLLMGQLCQITMGRTNYMAVNIVAVVTAASHATVANSARARCNTRQEACKASRAMKLATSRSGQFCPPVR